MERVTYQPALDFMIESRHHVGTFTGPRPQSFAWRDNHHFAFEVPTLAAQYMANPSAYDRMPRQVSYIEAAEDQPWGALAPYDEEVPDIVKLIHWGTDYNLYEQVTYALIKGQYAAFLYAYPAFSEFIPREAYEQVLQFTLDVWEKEQAPVVEPPGQWPHDEPPEDAHNMLALDTTIGSTKGAHPPAHSIMPNLYLYEVARREGMEDPERFFDAAYRQAQWAIEHLDWSDPKTTKGQRMAEQVTITGLAMFALEYPDQAPDPLLEKLTEWAEIMVGRSDNLWDFRRLSADQWTPTGPQPTMWNEPGSVAGFAGCALGVCRASPTDS